MINSLIWFYNLNLISIFIFLLTINIFYIYNILNPKKIVLLFITFITIIWILINFLTNNFVWFFFFMIYVGGLIVYLLIFLFSIDDNNNIDKNIYIKIKHIYNLFTFEYIFLNFCILFLYKYFYFNDIKITSNKQSYYFNTDINGLSNWNICHNLFENHIELFFFLGLILTIITISLTTIFKN